MYVIENNISVVIDNMKMHDSIHATQHLHVPTRFASESSHSSAGRNASENALCPHPVQHENRNVTIEQPHEPIAKNASSAMKRP